MLSLRPFAAKLSFLHFSCKLKPSVMHKKVNKSFAKLSYWVKAALRKAGDWPIHPEALDPHGASGVLTPDKSFSFRMGLALSLNRKVVSTTNSKELPHLEGLLLLADSKLFVQEMAG